MSNAKKPGKVLEDYRKVGKTKFIPPLLQNVNFKEISWHRQTLPELIWWDVLADTDDKASFRFAARVAETFSKYFKTKENSGRWWAFISDYDGMADNEASMLRSHLMKVNLLPEIERRLGDFLNLYPACPLVKILSCKPTKIPDIGYLLRFEARLRELIDKRSRRGVLAQAQSIYMAFLSGKLQVKNDIALADFPDVESYPSTEKSRKIGASICACVNMLAGMALPKYSDDTWVHYFWERSFELQPFNFNYLENHE